MNAGSPAFPRRYTYQLSFTAEGPPGSTATARSEPLAIDALRMERLHVAPADEGGSLSPLRLRRADANKGETVLTHLVSGTVLRRGDVVEIDAELPAGGKLVACNNEDARWFNKSTRKFYCGKCAGRINLHNPGLCVMAAGLTNAQLEALKI